MKAKPHYLAGLWCQFCFSVRCKRPGTISQTQHHTHPVDSWQRSSDTPGEKRYVINIFALVCYCHSLLIGRAKMSQQMELNGCYWALPVQSRCTAHDLSSQTVNWSDRSVGNPLHVMVVTVLWKNVSQQQLVRSACCCLPAWVWE